MRRAYQEQCGWPHLSPFTAYSYGCGCERCVRFMRLYRANYRATHPELAEYQRQYQKHYQRRSQPPKPPKPKVAKRRGPKPKPMPPIIPYPPKRQWND